MVYKTMADKKKCHDSCECEEGDVLFLKKDPCTDKFYVRVPSGPIGATSCISLASASYNLDYLGVTGVNAVALGEALVEEIGSSCAPALVSQARSKTKNADIFELSFARQRPVDAFVGVTGVVGLTGLVDIVIGVDSYTALPVTLLPPTIPFEFCIDNQIKDVINACQCFKCPLAGVSFNFSGLGFVESTGSITFAFPGITGIPATLITVDGLFPLAVNELINEQCVRNIQLPILALATQALTSIGAPVDEPTLSLLGLVSLELEALKFLFELTGVCTKNPIIGLEATVVLPEDACDSLIIYTNYPLHAIHNAVVGVGNKLYSGCDVVIECAEGCKSPTTAKSKIVVKGRFTSNPSADICLLLNSQAFHLGEFELDVDIPILLPVA